MYLQGRPPPSVNMYWRRFAIADMPLHDHEAFDVWLRERWREKDDLMNKFLDDGRFPTTNSLANGNAKSASNDGNIETEVKLAHWWEVGNIFVVLAAFGLVANIASRVWNFVLYGKQ
jgi:lysocardiolipin and lysophospholipid acyltransferase